MSTQRFAVFGLTGLLLFGGLPVAAADARPKGLHKGSHGPSVKRLQRNLTRAGFATAADGAFGPATKAKLMSWEHWKHRRVDGIATRLDRRKLRRSARWARCARTRAARSRRRRAADSNGGGGCCGASASGRADRGASSRRLRGGCASAPSAWRPPG